MPTFENENDKSKGPGVSGPLGHFQSSEQHADSTSQLARYDFLLVVYV